MGEKTLALAKKALWRRPRRAVKDADKLQKRQELLQIAGQLFLKKDFAALSMDEVAEKARVAKGTLYLYFRTKEELALGVLTQDMAEWLTAQRAYLESAPHAIAPAAYAAWFCNALRERPRYTKIVAAAALILEQNISKEAARDFKVMVAQHVEGIAPLLARRLKLRDTDAAARFMMQCHALIAGLWPCCNPSPVMASIVDEEKLDMFRQDFYVVLEDAIIRLVPN